MLRHDRIAKFYDLLAAALEIQGGTGILADTPRLTDEEESAIIKELDRLAREHTNRNAVL
jgi:SepF-like predicted cell division protein (DUF552 family)